MRTVILCLILFPFLALSEGKLAGLHTEFSKLRNNDLGFSKKDAWWDLERRLETALSQEKNSPDYTRGLFDALLISERVGINEENSEQFENALRFAAEILNKHGKSYMFGFTKLVKGDLLLRLGREEEARNVYLALLREEPSEYLKKQANGRLDGLDLNLYPKYLPSPFLQPPSLIQKKQNGKKIIVIDPGHGGDDTGACHQNYCEKDITLDISRKLMKELEMNKSFSVILTRKSDYFVPLALRTEKANNAKADVFVSVHINSTGKGDLRGIETYYLDTTNDEASRRLAERESATLSDSDRQSDLSFILSDLVQTGKVENSVPLAHALHTKLILGLKSKSREVLNLGIKKGPFFVLMGVKAPCVLNELFFIDNPADLKMLNDQRVRQEIASALAAGIKEFLSGDFEKAPKRDSLKTVRSKIAVPRTKAEGKQKKGKKK